MNSKQGRIVGLLSSYQKHKKLTCQPLLLMLLWKTSLTSILRWVDLFVLQKFGEKNKGFLYFGVIFPFCVKICLISSSINIFLCKLFARKKHIQCIKAFILAVKVPDILVLLVSINN